MAARARRSVLVVYTDTRVRHALVRLAPGLCVATIVLGRIPRGLLIGAQCCGSRHAVTLAHRACSFARAAAR